MVVDLAVRNLSVVDILRIYWEAGCSAMVGCGYLLMCGVLRGLGLAELPGHRVGDVAVALVVLRCLELLGSVMKMATT